MGKFDRVMYMILGVPREVKDHESRVGITPAGVHALVASGHTVLVEHNAGSLSAMPAAVPHTSTLALTNSTFPYLLKLANLGANAAIQEDAGIAEGVNTFHGTLTCKPVADSQHREWKPIAELV